MTAAAQHPDDGIDHDGIDHDGIDHDEAINTIVKRQLCRRVVVSPFNCSTQVVLTKASPALRCQARNALIHAIGRTKGDALNCPCTSSSTFYCLAVNILQCRSRVQVNTRLHKHHIML